MTDEVVVTQQNVQQVVTTTAQSVTSTVESVKYVVTAGVAGAPGVAGPQGPAGPTGPQGPAGDSYIGGVLTVVTGPQVNDLLAFNGTYWTNKEQTLVTDGGNF